MTKIETIQHLTILRTRLQRLAKAVQELAQLNGTKKSIKNRAEALVQKTAK